MKAIERRIAAIEAQIPDKNADKNAAVVALLEWALSPELDALQNIIERHHRGQPAAGDDALIEELTARWNSRCVDPTLDLVCIHGATKSWHRGPDRRLIGHRWVSWLSAFSRRDDDGETTEGDWATWHKLMNAVELFIVKQAPLPEGVVWGPDGMPAALLEDDAR